MVAETLDDPPYSAQGIFGELLERTGPGLLGIAHRLSGDPTTFGNWACFSGSGLFRLQDY